MKTLKDGRKRDSVWWLGLHLCCPACGAEFELEPGDERHIAWTNAGSPTEQVMMDCMFCRREITAIRKLRELEK